MGNLTMDKITLSFNPDEFYALQDIVNQWYRENRSKYDGFEEHTLIKVANKVRNLQPIKVDGIVTVN
jgi:hypothetical protein